MVFLQHVLHSVTRVSFSHLTHSWDSSSWKPLVAYKCFGKKQHPNLPYPPSPGCLQFLTKSRSFPNLPGQVWCHMTCSCCLTDFLFVTPITVCCVYWVGLFLYCLPSPLNCKFRESQAILVLLIIKPPTLSTAPCTKLVTAHYMYADGINERTGHRERKTESISLLPSLPPRPVTIISSTG